MKLPEKLLHFIWRYKLIDQTNLCTTQGESLRIIDFGQLNTNAGADFELAKIQIQNRIWIGNIELHVSSLDWKYHQHHLDPRYNSTILHVVWENPENIKIKRLDGTEIPTLILKDYIDQSLLEKYHHLMMNEQWIACENQLHKVTEFTISNWLDRLIIERLESKMVMVNSWAKVTSYEWQKVQLIALARAFGMKVNNEAFEKLMTQMNINLFYKYADDPLKIEALLFGCAGFLKGKNYQEDYFTELKEEYEYLNHLHGFRGLSSIEWKFLRMRPYNFPTFRLAQFSGLLHKRVQWFEFVQVESLEALKEDLIGIQTSSYWKNHFHFHKLSKDHNTTLTRDFIDHIILNAFVPVLFSYGRYVGNQDLQQKALDWLQVLPVEKNTIVKSYQIQGICAKTAGESQALIHLYKQYCTAKRCLDCAIGYALLSR